MDNILEESFKNALLKEEEKFTHQDRLYPTHSSTFVNYGKYKKLHGKCIRAAYYGCIGIAESKTLTEEEQMSRKLQQMSGEYIEKMILDILERQGVLISKAVKFEVQPYKIHGKLDGIIQDKDKVIGLEIKSIGSNKFLIDSIFGSHGTDGFPKWQNLFQTLIYCYAFRGIIDIFYLLYIRRDTGERRIFKISTELVKGKIYPVIDDKIDYRYTVNDILNRYKLLITRIDSLAIPEKEYMKIYSEETVKDMYKLGIISKRQYDKYKTEPFGDFECAYCGYKDICN